MNNKTGRPKKDFTEYDGKIMSLISQGYEKTDKIYPKLYGSLPNSKSPKYNQIRFALRRLRLAGKIEKIGKCRYITTVRPPESTESRVREIQKEIIITPEHEAINNLFDNVSEISEKNGGKNMNFEKMNKSMTGDMNKIVFPDFRQIKLNKHKKGVGVSSGLTGKYHQYVDKENKIVKFVKVGESKSTGTSLWKTTKEALQLKDDLNYLFRYIPDANTIYFMENPRLLEMVKSQHR